MQDEKILTWISGNLLKLEKFSQDVILFVGIEPVGHVIPEEFYKNFPENLVKPFSTTEILEIKKKSASRSFPGGMIISGEMMKRIDLSRKPVEVKIPESIPEVKPPEPIPEPIQPEPEPEPEIKPEPEPEPRFSGKFTGDNKFSKNYSFQKEEREEIPFPRLQEDKNKQKKKIFKKKEKIDSGTQAFFS